MKVYDFDDAMMLNLIFGATENQQKLMVKQGKITDDQSWTREKLHKWLDDFIAKQSTPESKTPIIKADKLDIVWNIFEAEGYLEFKHIPRPDPYKGILTTHINWLKGKDELARAARILQDKHILYSEAGIPWTWYQNNIFIKEKKLKSFQNADRDIWDVKANIIKSLLSII